MFSGWINAFHHLLRFLKYWDFVVCFHYNLWFINLYFLRRFTVYSYICLKKLDCELVTRACTSTKFTESSLDLKHGPSLKMMFSSTRKLLCFKLIFWLNFRISKVLFTESSNMIHGLRSFFNAKFSFDHNKKFIRNFPYNNYSEARFLMMKKKIFYLKIFKIQ